MKKPFDILLVEDCPDDAEQIMEVFREVPIVNKLIHAESNSEAHDYLSENHPDLGLVISDFYVDGVFDTNEGVLKLAEKKEIPFIYLSGVSGAMTATEAYRQGALTFLEKPLDLAQLLAVIKGLDSLGLEIVSTLLPQPLSYPDLQA